MIPDSKVECLTHECTKKEVKMVERVNFLGFFYMKEIMRFDFCNYRYVGFGYLSDD